MSAHATPSIPSLDLNDFRSGDPARRQQFIQTLGQAYQEVGFVAVVNHGFSEADRIKLYDTVQKFFELPQPNKDKYEIAGLGGQRGYTGKGKEHAKGSNTGDLKEFYHVGQPNVAPDADPSEYPANIWPVEIPEFKDITLKVYTTLETAGRDMLRAIALYLGLDEFYFDAKIEGGNSILRPIHYYPIENPDTVPADAVRAGEHEDINLITLLMGASAEGLQILTREGQWVGVTALPDAVVVNVGDMLQRLTNNVLRSTTHRVVNPPREKMNTSRYSIPFFLHPRSDMKLDCLPSTVTANNPLHYEPITAGEYLRERLIEIGLLPADDKPS